MARDPEKTRRPALSDPGNVPTVWATELTSIEVQNEVTVLTFAETLRMDMPDEGRRVCARVAIRTSMLLGIARRIDGLKSQVNALARPAGSA